MEMLHALNRGWITDCLLQGRPQGSELLVGEESLPQLRVRLKNEPAARELLLEIEQEAERLLGEREPELPFSLFRQFAETGERLNYERAYFERRRRLNSFAIMSFIHPHDEKYTVALCNTIWSICGEVTWCLPAHAAELGGKQEPIDLFAAETGFALCELVALLGEQLTDMLRSRITQEVERRLFVPFMEQGPYEWETSEHNWSAVCAGSIGAAALYVIEDEKRLAALLERVLAAMDCFLSGYGDDGACAEGYLYWQYGFGYFVYFAALLKTSTNGTINLFVNSKVEQIALFQQKVFTSGSMVVNFSDSLATSGIFMGLSSCLREQYPDFTVPDLSLRAVYIDDHCARWAPAIRNLLWVKGAGERQAEEPLWPTASYYLPDAQWLHSRVVDGGNGTYSFAAKGGYNDEPHNHNDVGHFILHADGEAYLADLGSGEYTAQYFGEGRYSYWCNGSQGHSVPIFGEELQQHGGQYRAEVLKLDLTEERDVFELELKGAYSEQSGISGPERPRLTSLKRCFQWRKKGKEGPWLELTDSFVFDSDDVSTAAAEVTERFITLFEPVVVKRGELLVNGKHRLRVCFDEERWSPVVARHTDNDHFGRVRTFYTLDFIAIEPVQGKLEGRFIFQFES